MHQKSLDIKLKVFGPDHPDLASTYCNMGVVYMEMGDYEKALEYYNKDLEIATRVHGLEHPVAADTLYNIALVH